MAETFEAEEDLEWEEWDRNISFTVHMVAGSLAGLAEHICMFPIDTLKTNIQCEKCGSLSPFQTVSCAQKIINRDGVFRLWRGVSATFAGCIPAHAAYFSVFESMKSYLKVDQPGHHPLFAAMCGASASFAHDIFMTPLDLVKQRMQLGYYRNVKHCLTSVWRLEGIGAFYRSMPITMTMNMPYGCVMVAANESAKKILNPSGRYNFTTTLLSGCIAGAVAAAATTPLDNIKTRLQTQDLEPCVRQPSASVTQNGSMVVTYTSGARIGNAFTSGIPIASLYTKSAGAVSSSVPLCESNPFPTAIYMKTPRYVGMFQTASVIFADGGYQGFFRGLGARVLVHAPSVAISWTTYETVKHYLSKFV